VPELGLALRAVAASPPAAPAVCKIQFPVTKIHQKSQKVIFDRLENLD
jgi:hypothetical protein